MTRPPRLRLLAVAALASLAAACATAPTPDVTTPMARPAVPPKPLASAAEHLNRAVVFLGQGRSDLARVELSPILVADPSHTVARKLMDQIDRDPKSMLGARNYPYKIRPGETLSMLADRFLGDPLLFYALARYNDIAAPDTAEVGRVLKIPGFPKAAPPTAARPAPKRRVETARPGSAPPATAPAAPATGPAPAGPAPAPALAAGGPNGSDPARAGRIRRAALEALNKGSVDQAVLLLRQAMPLDPANPAIKSDLARAERIQATVRNR